MSRRPLVDGDKLDRHGDDETTRTPYEAERFAEEAGLSVDEVVELAEQGNLYTYGASGSSSEEFTVDAPGRIGASGSSHVKAELETDGPVVVGASGSASIILSGNHDAVVYEATSGDAEIVYED